MVPQDHFVMGENPPEVPEPRLQKDLGVSSSVEHTVGTRACEQWWAFKPPRFSDPRAGRFERWPVM